MSTIIGVDIAYDSLKVIGLEPRGTKYRLVGMNVAPIPADSWTTDELKNQEEIGKVLTEALAAAKPHAIGGKLAMMALPESVIFSGTFSVPTLTPKELAQALPFQIAEKLSINLEDYYVDYEVTSSSCKPIAEAEHHLSKPAESKDTKKSRKTPEATASDPAIAAQTAIFAVAAKRTLIQSITDLFQAAKLDLGGIDIKPGAVVRSVIPPRDRTMRLIIDLGAGSTVVIVAEGPSLHLTSSVPMGTKTVGEGPDALSKFKSLAGPIFDELVHVTKFYENRICPGEKIRQVILTGGGSNIDGIAELFAEQTGLETKLGGPFSLVETGHYPVSDQIARTFADATGLAMRKQH